MRIDYHPEATEELLSSAAWYKERSDVAVQRFAIAVDEAMAKIEGNPSRLVMVDSRHRSCGVIGFPFQIVFRHESDQIYIVAIAHAKRRPGYWRA